MKKPKKSLKDHLGNSREFIKYTNIAFKMVAIILIGVFAGRKLDDYFQIEKSILTLVFSLLAVCIAMYVVIREINSK